MQLKSLLAITACLLLVFSINAQTRNPYKSIAKKAKTLTLSNGKYDEFFDEDSIQRIGSALLNINTMQLVKLQLTTEEQRILDNSNASRFLSVDPLTATFPMLTPYQFAANCPIAGVDMDGLEFYFAADGSYLGQSKNGGTQIRVATEYHTIASKQRVFTKYKDIDKVDPNIASKVYETIFRREVGDGVKAITVINATDKPSLGAQTTGKGLFNINAANVENGEKLNSDYYNAAATLYHEDKHSKSLPQWTSDGFSHFGIQKQVVEKSGLYEKTSANFKGYVKQLFEQYLGHQVKSLQDLVATAHSDPSQAYTLNYYLKEYKSNVEYYNKKYGEKMQSYDFKTFEKTLYKDEKSVIE